jgi:hypothetical protein
MTSTNTFNAATLKTGDRVIATYLGNTVEGTVRHTRWHSYNHEALEVWIQFDQPTTITLYGKSDERNSLLVYVTSDGSNCDSYSGFDAGHSVRIA